MVSATQNTKKKAKKLERQASEYVGDVTGDPVKSEVESVKVSDEDARTIATADQTVFNLQQQLGRAREYALNVETEVMAALVRARHDYQTILVTVGKKNGLEKIGTSAAQYNYDADTATYTRTR